MKTLSQPGESYHRSRMDLVEKLVSIGFRVTKTVHIGGDKMSYGDKPKKKLKSVCGMWLHESQTGKKYMRGKSEDGTVFLLFKNESKKNPRHPDYSLSVEVSDDEPQEKPEAKKPTHTDDLPF